MSKPPEKTDTGDTLKESSTSSTSSEDLEARFCAVCSGTCLSEYDCPGNGTSCDLGGEEAHFHLQKWVEPLIVFPFGHCHELDFEGHVFGKMDHEHRLFKKMWDDNSKELDPILDRMITKCPQCNEEEIRSSSALFNEGYFEVVSFKCYVCAKGCVSCYSVFNISGMCVSMSGLGVEFFTARAAGSRIDLSDFDSNMPQRGKKRPRDTPTNE